jgi:hypothetical protein
MLHVKTTSAIHIFKEIKSDLWNCKNIATVSARTYQTINFKNRTLRGNMVRKTGKCKIIIIINEEGTSNVSVIQMCRISKNREATLNVSAVPEKGENTCSSLLQHNSLPKCSDGPF